MATTGELQNKIQQLENELAEARQAAGMGTAVRQKILEMSSEVVDSNPYRWELYNEWLMVYWKHTV